MPKETPQNGYPKQLPLFDADTSIVEGGYGPDAQSLPMEYGLMPENFKAWNGSTESRGKPIKGK